MLCTTTRGNLKGPSLLFLHGFLGSKEDWHEIIGNLENDFCCHALDLPGHGKSPLSTDFLEAIAASIKTLHPFPDYFIGYSLGGRLLLQLKEKYPALFKHLLILSAHPGLATKEEREERWKSDQLWIEMLQKKPLSTFFDAWYAQPLFQSLKENKLLFESMLERRKNQDAAALAEIFKVCSLAHQKMCKLYPNSLFLFGAKDLKFESLYLKLPSFIKVQKIDHAGHALHLENPGACIAQIRGYVHATIGRGNRVENSENIH